MVDSTGRFSEWILLGLFTILATTLFSCDRLLPNTPPDYVQDDSTNHNCYSYAFGLLEATDPGFPYALAELIQTGKRLDYFGRDKGRIYTMEEMITFIQMDMKYLGIPIRIVDSPNDRLDDEYIVAVNISNTFLPKKNYADYHFAVMLSDGTWADKQGETPSRWNAFDATQHAWDLGAIKGYYNVGPKYIAVKRVK